MEITELDSAQAARWIWESLWSVRRHARMDILDVALFDEPEGVAAAVAAAETATVRTIARWLFTAKDGRIMKKSANNASVGALKQALLGRVLRGAIDGDKGSTGRIFATALLNSGESVPLDEDTWASLIVGGGGGRERVTAVTALFPGDPMESRRGFRQRVACEYRTKGDITMVPARVSSSIAVPMHASTTTWIVVSPGLLREAEETPKPQDQDQDREKRAPAAGGTSLNGRLISRVKSTNREVEAKLRGIVQWVQEVRRVHVLSMTAIFTVLPSLGPGAPGVWLEQALDVRVVPQETKMMAAPIAGPHRIPPMERKIQDSAGEGQHSIAKLGPPGGADTERVDSSASEPQQSSETGVKAHKESECSEVVRAETDLTASTKRSASLTPCVPNKGASSPTLMATSSVSFSAPDNSISTADIYSTVLDAAAAADAPAAAATPNALFSSVGGQTRSKQNEGGAGSVLRRGNSAGSEFPLAATADVSSQRGRPLTGAAVSLHGHRALKKCAGDFCALEASSELPAQMQKREKNSGDGKPDGGLELDWTSISAPKEGSALLEFSRPASPTGLANQGDWFSLTFKSVGLARMEADRGQDGHWGEPLRKCWRDGVSRKAGLEGLGPAEMYEEVSVCRSCYDVYRRLDKLRDGSTRGGVRGSGGLDALAMAPGGRRAAAVEVGAATLNAEVTAMLQDVHARTGRSGNDASIIWRRRLSKSKSGHEIECATAQSQAILTNRLSRPKPQAQQTTDEEFVCPRGPKRRVRSQGGTEEYTRSHFQRRSSAPCGLPALMRRGGDPTTRGAPWEQMGPISRHSEEEGVDIGGVLPHGTPRRTAWPFHRNAPGDERPAGGSDNGVVPRRGNINAGPSCAGGGGLSSGGGGSDGGGGGSGGVGGSVGGGSGSGSGGGGGGEPSDRGSRATICVIEAMLKAGSDSYLPARARDLPEAADVLGPRPMLPSGLKKEKGVEKPHYKAGNHRRRSRRRDKNRARGGNRSPGSVGAGDRPTQEGAGVERAEERFLHPWQRALEANKRAAAAPEGEEHEATLATEQRRRQDARGAAAASQGCRMAGKRVAERLGRHPPHHHKRNRRRNLTRRSRQNDNNNAGAGDTGLIPSEGSIQDGTRLRGRETGEPQGGTYASADPPRESVHTSGGDTADAKANAHATAYANANANGNAAATGSDCLHQMRDALGWARKTLGALVKRLRDGGVAVQGAPATVGAKAWEVVRLVNEIRRRLAAFEDEGVTLGMEDQNSRAAAATTAAAAASGRNAKISSVRSRGDAACDSFEAEFGRLIDQLTVTARKHLRYPEDPPLIVAGDSSRATASREGKRDRPVDDVFRLPAGDSRAVLPLPPTPKAAAGATSASSFGLCPSCSTLPVVRRCLDCDGSHANRDRCAGCFARDHRDASRRNHRFLRISGGGGGGGGSSNGSNGSNGSGEAGSAPLQSQGGARWGEGGQGEATHHARRGENPDGSARCSKCGDLSVARRCRDCRVDACAACHFLAHRSPSRQAHVTELIGEAAVAMQESLHLRTGGGSRISGDNAGGAGMVSSPPSSPSTSARSVGGGDGSDVVSDHVKQGGVNGVFGKNAAQSLAEVRRGIEAPVVPPLVSDSSTRFRPPFCGSSGRSLDLASKKEFQSEESPEGGMGSGTSLESGNRDPGSGSGQEEGADIKPINRNRDALDGVCEGEENGVGNTADSPNVRRRGGEGCRGDWGGICEEGGGSEANEGRKAAEMLPELFTAEITKASDYPANLGDGGGHGHGRGKAGSCEKGGGGDETAEDNENETIDEPHEEEEDDDATDGVARSIEDDDDEGGGRRRGGSRERREVNEDGAEGLDKVDRGNGVAEEADKTNGVAPFAEDERDAGGGGGSSGGSIGGRRGVGGGEDVRSEEVGRVEGRVDRKEGAADSASSSAASEGSEEDTEDEGMMWSPLNIAMVGLDVSASEGEDDQAPPVSQQLLRSPYQVIDQADGGDDNGVPTSQEEVDRASVLSQPRATREAMGGNNTDVLASQKKDDQVSPFSSPPVLR